MEGNQIFQLEQVDPPRPGTEHSPPPGSAARLLLAAARSRDGSSANQEARLGAATNQGRDLGWGRWWTLARVTLGPQLGSGDKLHTLQCIVLHYCSNHIAFNLCLVFCWLVFVMHQASKNITVPSAACVMVYG